MIDDILKKKTLRNIDKKYVEELIPEKIPKKKKKYKELVKKIRNELNKVYGVFQLHDRFDLTSHKSAKERMNIYPVLYKRIFEVTGKPKSVLDLGCGLNPLSYKHLECSPKYVAAEWNSKDVENLNNWFKSNNINGKAVKIDLRKQNKFPKTDIVFLFKVLGIFNNHKIDEQIIKSLNSKWVVASFPVKDLKGRKMNYPVTGWFNRMLKRLKLTYKKLKFNNEIFYIIQLFQ